MRLSLPQLKEHRRMFARTFAISIVIYGVASGVMRVLDHSLVSDIGRVPLASPYPTPSPGPLGGIANLIVVVPMLTASAALITAVVTLAGFLYTSLLTWRKERREAVLADLEVEKRRLENEKLRRDLEQPGSPSTPHLDL